MLRELTPQEWAMVSGGYDGGDIWVWGYGSIWYNDYWGSFGSGTLYDDVPPDGIASDGGGGGEIPPDPCSTMTAAESADAEVDSEAAEVMREILALANQNSEYGSILYRDSAGNIQHTPLISSPDYKARLDIASLPTNADGTPDYSRVVGFIHSHPQFLPHPTNPSGLTNFYDPLNPERLLVPSLSHPSPVDGSTQGDWVTWDSFVANIAYDGGDASTLRQYIVGFNGTGLELREYNSSDRETTRAADGNLIDVNTAPCPH